MKKIYRAEGFGRRTGWFGDRGRAWEGLCVLTDMDPREHCIPGHGVGDGCEDRGKTGRDWGMRRNECCVVEWKPKPEGWKDAA